VPPKGCSIGWEERNVHLGEAWQELSTDEKMVFDPRIFSYFSKLPIYTEEDEEENENDENPADLLTPEEEALYQPLYDKLVNHEKVALVADKPGERGSGTQKQALKHVSRINAEVIDFFNDLSITILTQALEAVYCFKSLQLEFLPAFSNSISWNW
jgi:hypothetical protein